MIRRAILAGLCALLLGSVMSVHGGGARAADECRAFPATGKSACGRFLQYWDEHGGLAQQGYPISDAFYEKSPQNGQTYMVQYFERARFEYHPENNPPYDVLLGLLGAEQFGARSTANGCQPGQAIFANTDRCVPTAFGDYWSQHGGLAQQGKPLGPAVMERNQADGNEYLTQYFERARFEYHPENDAANQVLLGLLGREQFGQRYPSGKTPAPLQTQPAAKPSIIGQSARFPGAFNDVPMQGTVTDVRQPTYLEWAGKRSNPDGKFLAVFLSVRNVGNKSTSVGAFSLQLMDAQGRRFDATHDMGAQLAASRGWKGKGLYDDINPGATATVIVVFDVPRDVDVTQLAAYEN